MAEMKIVSFKEDDFDMEKIKREADFHTKAVAREKKVRRNYKIAQYIIIVSLFVAGYCLYYLASDLIARYDYIKYHTADYIK